MVFDGVGCCRRSLRHALHERARSVALLQKHSRSCPKHHRRLSVRKRETLDVLELDTNETLRANPRYIYTVTETGAPELQKDRVSFSGRWITFVGKKATNRRGALVLFHSCTLCGKYTRRCSRHAPRRRREFPRPSCSWRASASPRIDLEREREIHSVLNLDTLTTIFPSVFRQARCQRYRLFFSMLFHHAFSHISERLCGFYERDL